MRKAKRTIRKWIRKRWWLGLAVLVLAVGAWRIWRQPRPQVLHRQDAWLLSAAPQTVSQLPDNAFTAVLPPMEAGRIAYVRDYSASGHYQIVWEDVSQAAAAAYLTALEEHGFVRLMGTAEEVASGVLLAKAEWTLSVSLSEGTMNLLMTRQTTETPTPAPIFP